MRGVERVASPQQDTKEIRRVAETIRRELRTYVGHGGSPASFTPRVKRAHRHLRRKELDKVLRVLQGLEGDLRERL